MYSQLGIPLFTVNDVWYTCWKEVPQELKDHMTLFCGDRDGGMDLQCGYCGKEFFYPPEYIDGVLQEDLTHCPHCNKELIFCSLFEW